MSLDWFFLFFSDDRICFILYLLFCFWKKKSAECKNTVDYHMKNHVLGVSQKVVVEFTYIYIGAYVLATLIYQAGILGVLAMKWSFTQGTI